ncbi:MAG: hypothetical protein HY506_01375 [Candidatus Yanofskybacteria bacterium]|nr:hypothetical protein [Candidatus Yanofskybacteria bacterium]
MGLEIFLEPKSVTLRLLKYGRMFDIEKIIYYHDLSRVLISGIDKILKKNRISPKALKTYKIQGKLSKDSTSYKIAGAFVAGLKINY